MEARRGDLVMVGSRAGDNRTPFEPVPALVLEEPPAEGARLYTVLSDAEVALVHERWVYILDR